MTNKDAIAAHTNTCTSSSANITIPEEVSRKTHVDAQLYNTGNVKPDQTDNAPGTSRKQAKSGITDDSKNTSIELRTIARKVYPSAGKKSTSRDVRKKGISWKTSRKSSRRL